MQHFKTSQCSLWLKKGYYWPFRSSLAFLSLAQCWEKSSPHSGSLQWFTGVATHHTCYTYLFTFFQFEVLVEDRVVESLWNSHRYMFLWNSPIVFYRSFFFSHIADFQLPDFVVLKLFCSTYHHLSSSWRACYNWILLVGRWGNVDMLQYVALSFLPGT